MAVLPRKKNNSKRKASIYRFLWNYIIYGPKNRHGLDAHDVRATVIVVIFGYIIFKLIDAFLEYVYMDFFDIIRGFL